MEKRIYEIVQQTKYLTEEAIKTGLAHKLIEKYAYILHDKDVNDEGNKKEDHWHVVIKLDKPYDINKVAKWFSVPPQYVEAKAGVGAFLDCVKYLTHEDEKQQEKGKFLYPDECVKANFDFRAELNRKLENELKKLASAKKRPADKLKGWIYDVLMEGRSLYSCMEEDPALYGLNIAKLQKVRNEYLNRQTPPRSRINIYISGEGGTGKGLASIAIARQFARTYEGLEDLPDDALYYQVGSDGSTFEGYDGQPVIIWNDCRSYELFKKLGSREAIYNIFETHPTKQRQNIKYSSVMLINKINIINSVQSPDDFINGLAGEYTDKNGEHHKAEDVNQVRRRIVITMELSKDYFEAQFNKGYFEDNDDYGEYYDYKKMTGNFGHAKRMLKEWQYAIVEDAMTKDIGTKIVEKIVHEEEQSSVCDDSEMPIEFASYGLPWQFMDIPDGIEKVEDSTADDMMPEIVDNSEKDIQIMMEIK